MKKIINEKFNIFILLINISCFLKLSASAQEFISFYQNLDILSKLLTNLESSAPEKLPEQKSSTKIPVQGFKLVLQAKNIQPELDNILQMDANKVKQKEALLNFIKALHQFVLSKKYDEKNKELIQNTINRIFESQTKKTESIDPMLIASAIPILKEINIPEVELYNLMSDLYEKQINFLKSEVAKLKGKAAYKGAREDLTDAMCYPMAIYSQIQEAILKNKEAKNEQAGVFVKKIEALQETLLKLLTDNRQALTNKDINVESYINMLETPSRQYCKKQQLDLSCDPYKPIFDELKDITNSVTNYKKIAENLNKCQRIFEKQQLIKKLNNYLFYLTSPDYCQHCFDTDFYNNIKANDLENVKAENAETALSDTLGRINKDFDLINNFFQDLPEDNKNIIIVENLRNLFIKRTLERDKLGRPV